MTWSSGTLVKVTAARIPSATRLMSVCENTVPATTGKVRPAGPSRRRLSTSMRVGSPSRPGNTAEAITPIIVARPPPSTDASVPGRAARSTACQESARSEQREHHQRERQQDPSRTRRDEGMSHAREVQAAQREDDMAASRIAPATGRRARRRGVVSAAGPLEVCVSEPRRRLARGRAGHCVGQVTDGRVADVAADGQLRVSSQASGPTRRRADRRIGPACVRCGPERRAGLPPQRPS